MNKKTLVILMTVMLGTTSLAFSQTLEENKVDEFTNNKVKRTSWEALNMTMKFTTYFRISRINDQDYFDLKMMKGAGVFSIDKDQEIMFKLSNGEFVKLPNLRYTVTCTGCGAKGLAGSTGQGIEVSYPINKEQFEQLKNNIVVRDRIYTTDGYVEDDTKEKNAKKISEALKLIEK
ncbi:hypothetical protein [Xanthocytophaga agilis]|uniref:DUF4468 domain-containing protein n=1 Tax=Xanthocytophaga agilis TaxID=3048010 RepID=A0AAE3R7Q4_9BACT|nr:hypothetical protein [Xanthocytophaga agilis]MDJ1505206.1 hypothetical protein [Xanthocytophaga agilis]